MINWDLILSDFNLHGTYGHFLVLDFSGYTLDLVFYHYDHFDYDNYSPSLDPFSSLSSDYFVKSVKMHRNFDYFHCVVVLSKIHFYTLSSRFSKYHIYVHK